MNFNHELTEKVIIAVVAAFSKDVIAWLWRRSSSLSKTLITILRPAIVAFLRRYWTRIIDVLFYAVMWVLLSPYLKETGTPATRADIFMISFITSLMAIWMIRAKDERDAKKRRPNQSSEPTTSAVTIPAAQEVVPAAVVAHL